MKEKQGVYCTGNFDISTSNRKMNKGFLIWNLPEKITCPGSTPICRENCYACKATRAYRNVGPCRLRNLEFTKRPDWTVDMKITIAKKAKSKSFRGFFRIHEAGDFYNQEYFDSWKGIAATFPEIRFLAFTKSFNLDFSNIPPNFQVIASIMEDTVLTPPAGFPKAFAGNCQNMGNPLPCPGLCDTCGMCWSLSEIGRDVHFDMH